MIDRKLIATESLTRGSWHTTIDLLKIGVPAFLLMFGIYWLGHSNPQKGLLVGLVFLVLPSSLAGLVTARHLRSRHRIRTFSYGNLRTSLFAGLWGTAWAVPFSIGIGLDEASFSPLHEYILAPFALGAVCFLAAALPVGRS
jgi:hypothetical protein